MKQRMKILLVPVLLILCALTLWTSEIREKTLPPTVSNVPMNTVPTQLRPPVIPPETSAPMQTIPPETDVPVELPEVSEPMDPPEVSEPMDPPEVSEPMDPPEVSVPMAPPEVSEPQGPPAPESTAPSDEKEPLLGWQYVDGGTYYYDPNQNGAMVTGWFDLEGERYYFSKDGKLHTGWLEYAGERYYLQQDGTMSVGQVTVDGVSRFFTSKGKYVVLVNKWNPVPPDYAPKLVEFKKHKVATICKDSLAKMLSDCAAAGHTYYFNAGYRSVATQQDVWDRRYQKYLAEGYSPDKAYALTAQIVALPGTSEHHLGLAFDIDGTWAALDWLAEHCWEYGFILRYPEGKSALTGITYEPWHFRYVGVELAMELRELDLCLEEYMAMLTQK
jgi:LAS superfamily LD-carboxypeptidase LdcB